MIPKRIIYCWFGGKEKPQNVLECIESWHKLMPDYDYLEINESNFDININSYCKKAYECKKWAYVSDVARLWALKEYGGIYMDTDVMVYKNLDVFLDNNCFTGFENVGYPVTAVMGAVKNSSIINEMLKEYDNREFTLHDNWWEYETNTMILSNVIGKYIDRNRDEYQKCDKITVYNSKTLCRGDYTEHKMFGSWG